MKTIPSFLFASSFWLFALSSYAAPVPYSGKVAINGENFNGTAKFAFELRDADGTIHWRNGADANASIEVHVDRGRYVVLLGGQGMAPITPRLFLDEPELYLKVRFYRADTGESLHLAPDQRITSTPHALSAEVARSLLPGTVTLDMLAVDARTKVDANATIPAAAITPEMLSPDTLAKFDQPIARNRLSQDVLDDLNRTITPAMLSPDTLAKFDQPIARNRLPQDVLDDKFRKYAEATFSPKLVGPLEDRTVTEAYPIELKAPVEGEFLTYKWYKNGNLLWNQTGPELSVPFASPARDAGNYRVVASNEWGSVETNATVGVDWASDLLAAYVSHAYFPTTDGKIMASGKSLGGALLGNGTVDDKINPIEFPHSDGNKQLRAIRNWFYGRSECFDSNSGFRS
jgi:hypothetical protein